MQEPLADRPDCGTGVCAFHVDLPLCDEGTMPESQRNEVAVSRTWPQRLQAYVAIRGGEAREASSAKLRGYRSVTGTAGTPNPQRR